MSKQEAGQAKNTGELAQPMDTFEETIDELLQAKFDAEANQTIVTLFGDIDLYNAAQLKKGLQEYTSTNLLIDCTGLKYIDSTGLGVLVSVLKQARTQGNRVQLVHLKPHLYKIFALTALDTLFEIRQEDEL